jgi:hypothetical protein
MIEAPDPTPLIATRCIEMTYGNLFATVGVACSLYVLWSLALATWSGTKMGFITILAIIAASCGIWAVMSIFLVAAFALMRGFVYWQNRQLSRRLAGELARDL